MGLTFVIALLAFICAVIGGALGRGSHPVILIAVAAALLSAIHMIGGALG